MQFDIGFDIGFSVKLRKITYNSEHPKAEKAKRKSPETRLNKGTSKLFTWWLIGESNPGHLD